MCFILFKITNLFAILCSKVDRTDNSDHHHEMWLNIFIFHIHV